MNKKLAIIQPYLPGYRVAFFDQLSSQLADEGIRLYVMSPAPAGDLALRLDSVDRSPEWHTTITDRSIRVGNKQLARTLRSSQLKQYDGIIGGVLGTSIDNYTALISKHLLRRPLKVGLWGHIDAFTTPGNKVDLALERLQMRFADQVFAYTLRGRDFAVSNGIPADKVTTVFNTIDSTELTLAVRDLSPEQVSKFAAQHSLHPHKTLSYIGGLDESKNIGLLAEILDHLWAHDRQIKILVGGRGADEAILDRSTSRGQAVKLGRVAAQEKALMAANSFALVNPGRVGLVAVDALALGLPVYTSIWPFHAPEIDYLTEGQSVHFCRPHAEDFANKLLHDIRDPEKLFRAPKQPPTLDAMTTNFAEGVKKMLR